MHMGYGFGMGYGMGGYGMGILFLIFWILVIIGFVLLIKYLWERGEPKKSEGYETALEILNKRYAKGEINKEEFEDKKKDLS